MRPIDADALLPNGVFYVDVDNPMKGLDELLDRIINAPTIDLAPVKRGEFERQPEEYIVGLHVTPIYCKTCDTTYFTMNKDGRRMICCPYCGALMGGKEDWNG